jgi:hypothetical protein
MTAQSLLPADRLPAEIAHLLRPELPPLGPGRPQQALAGPLRETDPNGWKRRAGALSADAAACCTSGLWLWNGFLEDSHSLSQAVHTPEGSWWHGIMHRREPDPGNAAYWFRRVGDHPLAGRDVPAAAGWLQTADRWDPFRFIDLCEQARGRGGLLEQLIREVAAIEWYVLFDFCRDADDTYSFTRSK